jgi:hypothetical protein
VSKLPVFLFLPNSTQNEYELVLQPCHCFNKRKLSQRETIVTTEVSSEIVPSRRSGYVEHTLHMKA